MNGAHEQDVVDVPAAQPAEMVETRLAEENPIRDVRANAGA